MSPAAQLPLTIIADDLTGACDTGALFAARGPVPVTVWPDAALRAPVSVVDTETRALDPADAARRVSAVARSVARTRIFKKIDSTLRGPIGAELDALLRATSAAGALVCPALPSEHRVVVERVLTVGAVPVAETAIAEDPTFPRAAGTSNVVDLLRPQLDRPFAWIPLGRVREGGRPLTARLVRLAGMVIVADAETDADLDTLVEAVLELDAPPLLVGAAGLALALARRLGLAAARVDPPAGERWLIVAGSQHPATRRQVEAARDAGLMVLATPDAPQADRARAGAEPAVRRDSRPIVIGAASAMSAALALVASPLTLHAVKRVADCRWADSTLEVLDLGNVDMASLPRAAVSAAAGKAAYDYVERAVALAQAHEIHGIVTAPINKEALAAAGMPHTGHTEILARLSNTADYAMLLMGRELRVIHVTTHVALRRVPDLVTRERVLKTIRLAHATMLGLGRRDARIAVAGLNPHAGEDGLFGDEEKTAIVPAIEAARAEGLRVIGPLPADTLLSRARGGEFDIVVAMYHDQGHIPVKTAGFEYDESRKTWTGLSGVNVTVGLPFLRVSVDHGTAFDRAWKGTANHESMTEAIEVAVTMLQAA